MINELLQPRPLGALIATVALSLVAAFVYLKNRSQASNRYFAYFNFALAIWNFGELFVLFTRTHRQLALMLDRVSFLGATAFIYWYLKLIASVTENAHVRERLMAVIYRVFFFSFLVLSVLAPTAFLVKEVNPPPNEEVPGSLFV